MTKYFYIILFTLFYKSAICQNTTIVYETIGKYPDEIIKVIPELSSYACMNSYSLHFNDRMSLFQLDSIKVINISPNLKGSGLINTESIYKNFINNTWVRYSSSYEKGKAIKKEISKVVKTRNIKWVPTGRKKKILNYNCLEVKTSSSTAWYTDEVNISDGPKDGIFGLKGLVLEYEDELNHYKAVRLINNTKTVLEIPSNLEFYNDESKIKRPIMDINTLTKCELIKLKATSEKNKWYTFDCN